MQSSWLLMLVVVGLFVGGLLPAVNSEPNSETHILNTQKVIDSGLEIYEYLGLYQFE